MKNSDEQRVEGAERGSPPGGESRRRSDTAPEMAAVKSLKGRLSFLEDSRFLGIVVPILGGLGIAILTAVIMRFV